MSNEGVSDEEAKKVGDDDSGSATMVVLTMEGKGHGYKVRRIDKYSIYRLGSIHSARHRRSCRRGEREGPEL
jgi:hypothetical protein